jgi:deoxyribonuclease-4
MQLPPVFIAYLETFMLLGAHMSIAGGLHNALIKAHDYGFDTMAMFVRNQRQWHGPPLDDAAVGTFRRMRRKLGIGPIAAHGSYLLNLAGVGAVRRNSLVALADEYSRCMRLGIDFLVIHPGSAARLASGIARLADALNAVVAEGLRQFPRGPTAILLETTAGGGNAIGGRFENLAAVLDRLTPPRRFGVCLDTCHIFAAGYDIRTPATYETTMSEFHRVIGLKRLRAIHLNDSKGDLGSRWDRHAHIGHGRLGRRAFALLVRDRRLARTPMILETPKETDSRGRDWDRLNADVLRRLERATTPRP